MPLNSSDSPEADGTHPNGIRFPMKDGDSTVFVTVSGLALDRRATRDRHQSSGDMATLFARYRVLAELGHSRNRNRPLVKPAPPKRSMTRAALGLVTRVTEITLAKPASNIGQLGCHDPNG
jgi:hypothetical protein